MSTFRSWLRRHSHRFHCGGSADDFDRDGNNISASCLLDDDHDVIGQEDREGYIDNCEVCGAAVGWLALPGADFGHTTTWDSRYVVRRLRGLRPVHAGFDA